MKSYWISLDNVQTLDELGKLRLGVGKKREEKSCKPETRRKKKPDIHVDLISFALLLCQVFDISL